MALLQEIEAFCAKHGLSDWQFGELALKDRHLVRQMRGVGNSRPRRLWPDTETRVRDFMAAYSSDPAERAA